MLTDVGSIIASHILADDCSLLPHPDLLPWGEGTRYERGRTGPLGERALPDRGPKKCPADAGGCLLRNTPAGLTEDGVGGVLGALVPDGEEGVILQFDGAGIAEVAAGPSPEMVSGSDQVWPLSVLRRAWFP